MKYQLQFEVCRLINTQSVLKIPFQIAKTRENAKIVLKIIFSTVLAFSRVFNFFFVKSAVCNDVTVWSLL